MATTQTVSAKANIYNPQDNSEKSYTEFVQNTTTLPEKIFVCEDQSPQVISLWKNLLANNNIRAEVISSEGSSVRIKDFCKIARSLSDMEYNPKTFTQVDGDGLNEMQIKAIETLGIFPLPVNEIENFAVIIDKKRFNKKFWKKNILDLEESLLITTDEKCKKYLKALRRDSHKSLFEDIEEKNGEITKKNTNVRTILKLRRMAINNPLVYFPGKDICKKLQNYNPINTILGCPKEKYPKELKEYLSKIKEFFMD